MGNNIQTQTRNHFCLHTYIYNCGTINSFSHALSIQIILLERRGLLVVAVKGSEMETAKSERNKEPDRKKRKKNSCRGMFELLLSEIRRAQRWE